MDLYKKTKRFIEISPVSVNIGTYLKDASKVCKIYYEMVGIDDYEKAKMRAERRKIKDFLLSCVN